MGTHYHDQPPEHWAGPESLDPTPVWKQYLLVAAGFQRVEIRYRAPYPEADKLQPVRDRSGMGDWAATLNANVEKLNSLLFTWLDYAAVGYRP